MKDWHKQPLAAFDLETSGLDVEKDRIVTAAVVVLEGGQVVTSRTWMSDPGIDIPKAASDIHGVTTARARAEGRPAAHVVEDIAEALAGLILADMPIVVMNATYDLTLLDRELARYGLPTLLEQARWLEPTVIDPLVIDRGIDTYRPGKRRLIDLAAHYGVALSEADAHGAEADAIAAARVAIAQAEREPALRQSVAGLHLRQEHWARQQAASLERYLRGKGRADAVVDGRWPMIPRQQDGGAR